MEYVGKTLVAPIWINNGKIYVATVDIPRGDWTLVLHLTDIQNSLLVLDNGYRISSVELWPQCEDDLLTWTASRSANDGMSWQIFFSNKLPGDSKTPVAYSYTINIAPIVKSAHRCDHHRHHPPHWRGDGGILTYDPVVVAQPDPIYP